MVGIIDYGMGNLYSVRNAFLSLGSKARIISSPGQLRSLDHVVLPGVGAFADAMDILDKTGMTKAIKQYVDDGGFFMGICLGLQLLFKKSQESPRRKGLGLMEGEVVRFKGSFKIPHMGWNELDIKRRVAILKGVQNRSFVYFCHSYYVKPKDPKISICTTRYFMNFTPMVAKNRVFGIQFHPEKSQAVGLKILDNFRRLKG